MRSTSSRGVVVLFAVAVGALPAACGAKQPPDAPPAASASGAASVPPPASASGPVATSSAPDAAAGAASTTVVDAGLPPLATVLTTDPNQLAALLKAAAGASQAVLQPQLPATDPVGAGIRDLAAKYAKGMQPDGPLATGDLKEGGHLSMLVNLQAGKCYSLVGFSPTGQVHDLDLRLLAPPFFTMISGEDTTDDNTPVVGKDPTPMCPLVPIPLAYKVDIHAQKGAGKAGVQLYSRAAK